MTERPTYEPAPKRSWQVLLLVAALLAGVIGAGIVYVRASRPAPDSLPMQGTQVTPAPPPVGPAPTVGRLGIDAATCPAFAEIAARFWDLKARGTTLDSAYAAIEQGSQGDAKKTALLKALAQVVYANNTPSRELAYRNALEACRKP